MHSESETFYTSLPVFDDFLDITDPGRFSPVPDDWHVVVTDVQGSTAAIRSGKYKDVNLAGASSIISILNIDRTLSVPFIFGGDGATLCIPDSWVAPARARLLGTVRMTREALDLSLRAGVIPVSVVRSHGHDLRVARNRVSAGFVQAVFTGGGAQFAEEIIKQPAGAEYLLAPESGEPVYDFSGLECRWNDVPSIHGEIVCLIVLATGTDRETITRTYRSLILKLRSVCGEDHQSRPIHPSSLRMTFFGVNPRREEAIHGSGAGVLRRLAYAFSMRWGILSGKVLMRFKQPITETDWRSYKSTLAANTDFRKFSDIFRQVLSGTPGQREELAAYCEAEFNRGMLVYGMHASPTALLTCLIFSYSNSHMHLVDGGNGGYALAAAQFKERLKRIKSF